jgi:hypothetical protein
MEWGEYVMTRSRSQALQVLLCTAVLVTATAFPSALGAAQADPATAAAKPAPKVMIQGPLAREFSCAPTNVDDVDANNDQVITITVGDNSGGDPKYKVTTSAGDNKQCAAVSHAGKLTFLLNKDLATGWQNTNTVDVEFNISLPAHPAPHGLKGPFDKKSGKPKKRGVYEDVFHNGNHVIPKGAISDNIKKAWIGGYTVKIWDVNGEFLGEVDPGVIVIDDPGGLKQK